jgi:hypothetical protein
MMTAGARRCDRLVYTRRPLALSRDLGRRDSTTTRFPATGRRG